LEQTWPDGQPALNTDANIVDYNIGERAATLLQHINRGKRGRGRGRGNLNPIIYKAPSTEIGTRRGSAVRGRSFLSRLPGLDALQSVNDRLKEVLSDFGDSSSGPATDPNDDNWSDANHKAAGKPQPVPKRPIVTNINSPSPNLVDKSSVGGNRDSSIEGLLEASKRHLFGQSKPQNDDDDQPNSDVLHTIAQSIEAIKKDVSYVKKMVTTQQLVQQREKRFLVIPGSSELFLQMLRTINGIVKLPFRSIEAINFQEKLFQKFDMWSFIVNVLLTNCTAGGSVFFTSNSLWTKLFSDELSKIIAWAAIGEPDAEDEDGGPRNRRTLGKSHQAFHMLRSKNPKLRSLMMREYNHISVLSCIFIQSSICSYVFQTWFKRNVPWMDFSHPQLS
jgi:hypothetical protein